MSKAVALVGVLVLGGVGVVEALAENRAGVPKGEGMLLATDRLEGGRSRVVPLVVRGDGRRVLEDLSSRAEWRFEPAGVVEWREGAIVPVANGSVVARASLEGKVVGERRLTVSGLGGEAASRVSFRNEIVPIFTKTSCNGGVCHGKASGQNGFKLSLFGF